MRSISKELLKYEIDSLGADIVVGAYLSPDRYRSDSRLLHFICPFHDDNNLGSAMVFLNKSPQDFYCYGCSKSGTLFDLAIGFARKAHPADAGNFNNLLEHIVEDLHISRDRVVESGGSFKKEAVVKEEVYQELLGEMYFVIEKDFEKVLIPEKKVLRVPTNTEKVWYKTLYISDKKLHNRIVVIKARCLFWDFLNKTNSVDAIEKFSQKQLFLLGEIPNILIEEERIYRKHAIERRKAILALLKK